jgi:hypothetical protein
MSDHYIHTQPTEDSCTLTRQGKKLDLAILPEKFCRMRIKRQYDSKFLIGMSAGDQAIDELLMSAMDTIKHTNSQP